MKVFRLPLLLLAFAAACGLLRWIQTFASIPLEAVRFAHLNDVRWDMFDRRVSRTGGDPYLVFDLPPNAIPIRQVTFYFVGHYVPTEGTFYVFQSDGTAIAGVLEQRPDMFQISATIEPSTTLRLDLPDFLPRSIQLERILIRKPFINSSAWSFRFMVLGLAGCIVTWLFVWRRRRTPTPT